MAAQAPSTFMPYRQAFTAMCEVSEEPRSIHAIARLRHMKVQQAVQEDDHIAVLEYLQKSLTSSSGITHHVHVHRLASWSLQCQSKKVFSAIIKHLHDLMPLDPKTLASITYSAAFPFPKTEAATNHILLDAVICSLCTAAVSQGDLQSIQHLDTMFPHHTPHMWEASLAAALSAPYPKVVEHLLSQPAPPRQQILNAFAAAVGTGNASFLMRLLDHAQKTDPDILSANPEFMLWTLQSAAEEGHIECVQALVHHPLASSAFSRPLDSPRQIEFLQDALGAAAACDPKSTDVILAYVPDQALRTWRRTARAAVMTDDTYGISPVGPSAVILDLCAERLQHLPSGAQEIQDVFAYAIKNKELEKAAVLVSYLPEDIVLQACRHRPNLRRQPACQALWTKNKLSNIPAKNKRPGADAQPVKSVKKM